MLVFLYTEVLFASSSFIKGTINLSLNIIEYFLPQFPTLSAWAVSGEATVTGMLNLGVTLTCLAQDEKSVLEAASGAVFTSPIPSWRSTLGLWARCQIKLNKLCWACSLSPSSSTGQSQQQIRRKSTSSITGAIQQGMRERKDQGR